MTTSNDIMPGEYAPFYANYIQLAPQNVSLITALDVSFRETFSFFSSLKEEQGNSRYAKDKWSLKEMLLTGLCAFREMTLLIFRDLNKMIML